MVHLQPEPARMLHPEPARISDALPQGVLQKVESKKETAERMEKAAERMARERASRSQTEMPWPFPEEGEQQQQQQEQQQQEQTGRTQGVLASRL